MITTPEQAIAHVRAQTDTVMLSFSAGKDSIAAWLALRDRFPKIIPVPVPGPRFGVCRALARIL